MSTIIPTKDLGSRGSPSAVTGRLELHTYAEVVCSWPGQEASALALLSPCGGIILLLSVLVRYRLATRQGMLCKIGLYLHANGIDLVAGTMAGRLAGAEKGLMHSRKIIRVKGINHSSHAETHRQQGVSRSLEYSCARQGKAGCGMTRLTAASSPQPPPYDMPCGICQPAVV